MRNTSRHVLVLAHRGRGDSGRVVSVPRLDHVVGASAATGTTVCGRGAAARPTPSDWRDDRVTIGWLGHATLLMHLRGKNVLTDPVFGESVGLHLPLGISFGPRRPVRCALNPEELPRLDLIVQSHAHMDHLDTRSWRRLRPGPAVVMAAHNARYIRRFGFEPVTELDWGESVEVAGQWPRI